MGDETPSPPPSEDLVFRRGKLRQRDDPAINLFREALASPEDLARVKQILAELARLYDPVRNGPIVDPSTRRAVVEDLEGGRPDSARQRLEAAFRAYSRKPEPPGTPPSPSL